MIQVHVLRFIAWSLFDRAERCVRNVAREAAKD